MCGISAFYSKRKKRLKLSVIRESLLKLQHRGRESVGISCLIKDKIWIYKSVGLVNEGLSNFDLEKKSYSSIGHVRYSTSGDSKDGKTDLEESQPFGGSHNRLGEFCFVFNGTLPNLEQLMCQYSEVDNKMTNNLDTEFLLRFIETRKVDSWNKVLKELIKNIPGVYSLILQTANNELYFLKDRYGIRPLSIGEDENNYYFSSETVGLPLKVQQQENHYEIRSGEIWKVNREESKIPILIHKEDKGNEGNMCLFEYIYFQRPKSEHKGQLIKDIRYYLGKQMAELVDNCQDKILSDERIDLVVGMPNSAIPAGIGFADHLGLKYEQVIWKVKNCGRTFILPRNDDRIDTVRKKVKFDVDKLKGKNIVLVDDSIVRGNTVKSFVVNLKKAGVASIHVRVISPPIKYPCFMGVDIPKRNELVAYNKTLEEIREYLNVDSLAYLDIKGIKQVTGNNLCTGCFTGKYPPGLLDW